MCWNKDASQRCHIPEHVLVQQLQVGRCTQAMTTHTSYNKYKQAALALTELPPSPLLGTSNWFWQELLHMLTEPSSTSFTFEIIYILVSCLKSLCTKLYQNLGAPGHRARCSITLLIRKQLKLQCHQVRDSAVER